MNSISHRVETRHNPSTAQRRIAFALPFVFYRCTTKSRKGIKVLWLYTHAHILHNAYAAKLISHIIHHQCTEQYTEFSTPCFTSDHSRSQITNDSRSFVDALVTNCCASYLARYHWSSPLDRILGCLCYDSYGCSVRLVWFRGKDTLEVCFFF